MPIGLLALLIDSLRASGHGTRNGARSACSRLLQHVGIPLVALLASYILIFHHLSNMPLGEDLLYGVHERFWQQPNLIVFVLLGVGFAAAAKLLCTVSAFAALGVLPPVVAYFIMNQVPFFG